MFSAIKNYIASMKRQTLAELPAGLKSGLYASLAAGEEVLFILRDFRAMHKAPRWVDSNTWFNSWFILTSARVIVAKNASSLKKLRDIPHDIITRWDVDIADAEPKVTIWTATTEDSVEFSKESKGFAAGLDKILADAVEKSRKAAERFQILDSALCFKCGAKIPRKSNFCPECGQKLS
ncbi:MAG: zinc ribbon domain-containing protein [Deltaproteobacteria bacterium]